MKPYGNQGPAEQLDGSFARNMSALGASPPLPHALNPSVRCRVYSPTKPSHASSMCHTSLCSLLLRFAMVVVWL